MKTIPKLFCFTLMPFDSTFDDIYKLGIKEACNIAGVYCERVDEQIFQETILERLYNQISKADLIVADMTDRNPNVFYEVGYAHALGKSTILLTQKAEDIPFDLKHFQHIVYNGRISYLKDELAKRIQWYVDNPPEKYPLNKFIFDIYLMDKNLLKEKIIFVYPKNRMPFLTFILHNPTSYTFEPDSFRIGIITPLEFQITGISEINSIKLPDNKYIHMLSSFDTIFPDSFSSFKILFRELPELSKRAECSIKIFTEVGTFEYPFYIDIDRNLTGGNDMSYIQNIY